MPELESTIFGVISTLPLGGWVATRRLALLGASQIKGFRPLLEKTFPSIYRIFRASQNTNRWHIIDTMFAKSQPLNARLMFFSLGGAFSLSLAVA